MRARRKGARPKRAEDEDLFVHDEDAFDRWISVTKTGRRCNRERETRSVGQTVEEGRRYGRGDTFLMLCKIRQEREEEGGVRPGTR